MYWHLRMLCQVFTPLAYLYHSPINTIHLTPISHSRTLLGGKVFPFAVFSWRREPPFSLATLNPGGNSSNIATSSSPPYTVELKLLVYRTPQLREQSVRDMFTVYGNEFPNLLMVIELCLIILVQTARVERGNSCLNRIMTDHRACLDVPTVSALMHIAINGPSHEKYDATRAVARWFTSGERRRRRRRPEYMDQNNRDVE